MISTKLKTKFIIFSVVALILNPLNLKSQNRDSLSLGSIINEVVQNHPLVKKATEELSATDAKIGIAKSGYLPNADFGASYTRIGPVSEFTLPGTTKSMSLMPPDNYSASVSVSQSIYDFGKTSKAVALEKQSKELNRQSIEQIKQRLAQTAIANYFSLVYLQEAIRIKDEQLKTLNEHLRFVEKKLATGSATQYEILTTQVRISSIENQKTDLVTAHQVQVSQLNSLLGKPENSPELVKSEINVSMSNLQNNDLIAIAMQNRDEMKLAREKAKLAELRYSLTNTQNNASLNGFATAGIKNGYIPNMYDPTPNFTAGVSFKIPIYDGKRTKYNLSQAKSAISINNEETEIARRSIVNEIVEMQSGVESARKKVDQSELQVQQASQAYKLAKVKFESGVITNLELLDGATTLSESRLMLLKSKIDYSVNLYKLKSAIGDRLY